MKDVREHIWIISITFLHGLITYLELGSMPHISLMYFDYRSVIAVMIWAIYGGVLYLCTQKWIMKDNFFELNRLQLIGICLGVPIVKSIIDWWAGSITANITSVMWTAVFDGIVNFLFGALIMFILVCIMSKKKINKLYFNSKVELAIAVGVIVLYVIIVSFFFWDNQRLIDIYDANSDEIRNLQYHYAFKIVDVNVCCYVLFYIFFWNFLRSATQDVQENSDNIRAFRILDYMKAYKKELKEFLCIVGVTFLHGLVTYFKLGGMPQIFFLYFDKSSALAIMIWAMYAAVLYLCVQGLIFKLRFSDINWYQLVGVVAGTPFIKGIIDLFIEKIMAGMESVMHIVVLDGVVNFVFGAILIYIVVCLVSNRKVNYSFQNLKLELAIPIGILVLYVLMVGYSFWQYEQVLATIETDINILNDPAYMYSSKITVANVCCYVLFYIFFWDFLRKLTKDKV